MHLTLAPLGSFDIGAGLAAIIAVVALRAHSLDRSGAVAAFVVGTLTFGALGIPGALVLLAFFVTSVGLSKVGKRRKRERLKDIGKTGARDAAQVFANGGIAALCALAAAVDRAHEHLWWAAFCGAFAAATADTWGTEVGTLARGTPRSILTGRPVQTGISGGVSLAGSLAEVAGAAAIPVVLAFLAAFEFAAIAHAPHESNGHAFIYYSADFTLSRLAQFLLGVFAGGVSGAIVDSVLGASLQTLRFCPQCERFTELEPHWCGANTRVLRGSVFFGNDAVNLACTMTGAIVAAAIAR